MSIRSLRARLDRLERANDAILEAKGFKSEFAVDPALARAMRDDYQRMSALSRKRSSPSDYGGPISAIEKEEYRMLRARSAERAKAIGCWPNYGQEQELIDSNRLHQLKCKRMSPPSCGGGSLNDAEDSEEAQLIARTTVFYFSVDPSMWDPYASMGMKAPPDIMD